MANLATTLWIPAFAGMTEAKWSVGATIARLNLASTYPYKPIKGEWIRWLLFGLGFGWLTIWIPAFAGMTGASGNDGR